MANHASAKKRIRQTIKKTLINKQRKSKIKNSIRKIEDAIKANKKEEASSYLKDAQSQIMRGVTKGIIKKKTASRKVSRLSALVKKSFA